MMRVDYESYFDDFFRVLDHLCLDHNDKHRKNYGAFARHLDLQGNTVKNALQKHFDNAFLCAINLQEYDLIDRLITETMRVCRFFLIYYQPCKLLVHLFLKSKIRPSQLKFLLHIGKQDLQSLGGQSSKFSCCSYVKNMVFDATLILAEKLHVSACNGRADVSFSDFKAHVTSSCISFLIKDVICELLFNMILEKNGDQILKLLCGIKKVCKHYFMYCSFSDLLMNLCCIKELDPLNLKFLLSEKIFWNEDLQYAIPDGSFVGRLINCKDEHILKVFLEDHHFMKHLLHDLEAYKTGGRCGDVVKQNRFLYSRIIDLPLYIANKLFDKLFEEHRKQDTIPIVSFVLFCVVDSGLHSLLSFVERKSVCIASGPNIKLDNIINRIDFLIDYGANPDFPVYISHGDKILCMSVKYFLLYLGHLDCIVKEQAFDLLVHMVSAFRSRKQVCEEIKLDPLHKLRLELHDLADCVPRLFRRVASPSWVYTCANNPSFCNSKIEDHFSNYGSLAQVVAKGSWRFVDDYVQVDYTDKVREYFYSNPGLANEICAFLGGIKIINQSFLHAYRFDLSSFDSMDDLQVAFNRYVEEECNDNFVDNFDHIMVSVIRAKNSDNFNFLTKIVLNVCKFYLKYYRFFDRLIALFGKKNERGERMLLLSNFVFLFSFEALTNRIFYVSPGMSFVCTLIDSKQVIILDLLLKIGNTREDNTFDYSKALWSQRFARDFEGKLVDFSDYLFMDTIYSGLRMEEIFVKAASMELGDLAFRLLDFLLIKYAKYIKYNSDGKRHLMSRALFSVVCNYILLYISGNSQKIEHLDMECVRMIHSLLYYGADFLSPVRVVVDDVVGYISAQQFLYILGSNMECNHVQGKVCWLFGLSKSTVIQKQGLEKAGYRASKVSYRYDKLELDDIVGCLGVHVIGGLAMKLRENYRDILLECPDVGRCMYSSIDCVDRPVAFPTNVLSCEEPADHTDRPVVLHANILSCENFTQESQKKDKATSSEHKKLNLASGGKN